MNKYRYMYINVKEILCSKFECVDECKWQVTDTFNSRSQFMLHSTAVWFSDSHQIHEGIQESSTEYLYMHSTHTAVLIHNTEEIAPCTLYIQCIYVHVHASIHAEQIT